MVIYEVNLEISNEVYNEYIEWLKDHIKKMLRFNGFIKALFLREENASQDFIKKVTVQYTLSSMDHLNEYLEKKAPAMREDGLKRFSNKFSANRRVFVVEEEFSLTS